MAVPKRKTSKMKKRLRKASKKLKTVQICLDENGKATLPHKVNIHTGIYKEKKVFDIE